MLMLPHLEALVAIAELGSFRAASERLNITQPSVSLRIKELEQSLGVQLFDRSGYRPQLTAEGREVLRLAQRAVAITREIRTIGKGKAAVRGKLRLGVADAFAIACLPALLGRLDARAPGLQIALDIDYSANLDAKLHANALDIAFLTSPSERQGVVLERLLPIDLAWVASPRFGLDRGDVTRADLAKVPIITNPEPSNLFTSIMSWFEDVDAHPQRISTCNSLLHIARLTASGVGAALLPLAIIQNELDCGVLTVINAEPAIEPHWMYLAMSARVEEAAAQIIREVTRKVVAASNLTPVTRRPAATPPDRG